jgi:hypothetical protein
LRPNAKLTDDEERVNDGRIARLGWARSSSFGQAFGKATRQSCFCPLYLKPGNHPSWEICESVRIAKCLSCGKTRQLVSLRPDNSAAARIKIHNSGVAPIVQNHVRLRQGNRSATEKRGGDCIIQGTDAASAGISVLSQQPLQRIWKQAAKL